MALIYLDFGHGGTDSGATGNGFKEKDLTLKLGQSIERRLKDHDFEVMVSRNKDVYVGNASERGKVIAQSKADYGLSIHFNSATNTSAKGGEIFIPCGEGYGLIEYHMANELGKLNTFRGIKSRELSDVKNHPTHLRTISDKGVVSNVIKATDYYGVIREAWRGGVSTTIVEVAFISNKDDMTVFNNSFDKYVEAIVKSICRGFKVDYREPKKEVVTKPSSKTMYRVVVASFESKESANTLKQELINKGYKDTFISAIDV